MLQPLSDLNNDVKDLLRTSTEAAAKLRSIILKDRPVLVLGGGGFRIEFVYPHLASLGVKVYMADEPESRYAHAPFNKSLTAFLPVRFGDDSKDVPSLVLDALADQDLAPPQAVLTFNEAHLPYVPAVAKAFDLPHFLQQALNHVLDKGVMRDVLAAAGLRTVRHAVLRTDEDQEFLEGVEHVGLPAIVKPINGYHSIGVRRFDTQEEALPAFHDCVREVGEDDDPVWLQGRDKILEEFIEGEEFVTETLMVDGEVIFAGIIEHTCVNPPWFELRGYVSSTRLPARLEAEVRQYIQDCLRALGFFRGQFDVEWRLARDGPVLLEVNPRMGAGPLWGLINNSYGMDLIESATCIALGMPYKRMTREDLKSHVIAFYLQAPTSGIVEDVSGLQCIGMDEKRVVEVHVYQEEGARVVGTDEGMPTEMGMVVVKADSFEEAKAVTERVIAETEVPIRPDSGKRAARFGRVI